MDIQEEHIIPNVVSQYNLDEEQEKKEIVRKYRALLRALRPKIKKGDKELLRTAFEMATNAHKTMRRKTGEPYIFHPISVAMICVDEIGLGVRSTICALLHDTVEDTDITLEDVKDEFGNEIAKIVDGLTKISTVMDTNSSQQAENFKKILLTLTDDPRVILIKLADRLHTMRTLDAMKQEKQLKISSETIWVYAPLAHRMGLYNMKTELEDLSMKYLEADTYKEIAKKLAETKRERTKYINEFVRPLKDKLTSEGFQFEIYGRPKSIHSIWNKIKKKGVSFEEVYDLFAIRILLDSPVEKEKEECWKVYSLITDEYLPSPERLRDWLSNPKSNGYEALHTTVMGPQGKWVEVQIRTKRMNEIAEKGLAAHFKYKEGSQNEDRFDKWFMQIREALGSQDEAGIDFLQDFKTSFLAEEIYVYTPKGEVKMLPTNSSALDFAFYIHTAIGSKCIGAKVNHKLVPISHKLRSGDQIEIITSNKQKPTEDWLQNVVTAKAKNSIKDALREEKKQIAEEGKYTLQRKLEGIGALYNTYNIDQVMNYYKLSSHLDLLFKIATKSIDLKELKLFQVIGEKIEAPKPVIVPSEINQETNNNKQIPKKDSELIIFGEKSDRIKYSLGKCCNPIPGDDVFGFLTINEGIKIHRNTCPNAQQLLSQYGNRVIKARWSSQVAKAFVATIHLDGIDRMGMIQDISKVISSELHINMRSLAVDTNDGIFTGDIKLYVQDTGHLETLMQKLGGIDGMNKVTRVGIE
jgi:GTP pyrophosphokinase